MFLILVNVDSTATDSMEVYEIPDIIDFAFYTTEPGMNCLPEQEVMPGLCDLNSAEAFMGTPLYVMNYGYGQYNTISFPGLNDAHTQLFINHHLVHNIVTGSMDLTLLSPFFFATISTRTPSHRHTSINMNSKKNIYDRPHSAIRYSTGDFGTSIYNVDFTRAITNHFGFYIDGLFWKSQGFLAQPYEIASLYSQFYTSKILPLRVDGLYLSNNHTSVVSEDDTTGTNIHDTFIDASVISGNKQHKIAMHYTMHINHESYPHLPVDVEHTVSCYGIDIANCHDISNNRITYHLVGEFNTVRSTIYGDIDSPRLGARCGYSRPFGLFCVAASGDMEYVSSGSIFYSPQIVGGVYLFDSTTMTVNISRDCRKPAIAETLETDAWHEPRCPVSANKDLVPEYYWSQLLTLQHKDWFISLYKHDHSNLITIDADSNPAMYTNVAVSQTIGVEGNFKTRFIFRSHADTSSTYSFLLSWGGNYVLKGDRFPLMPQRNGYAAFEIRRDTERFAGSMMLCGQYVGPRIDINGYSIDEIAILSAIGQLRFVTLTFALRVNNLLNDTHYLVSGYLLPKRNIMFTVRWEFFN